MEYTCLYCGKRNKKEGTKHKYCNKTCYYKAEKGRILTDEHKKNIIRKAKPNITSFYKGQPAWNKGLGWKNDIRACLSCGSNFNPAKNNSKFCSKSCASSYIQYGKEKSLSSRIKMALAKTKSNVFNGFKKRRNKSETTSKEYNHWRMAVFERDDFRCQICGNIGIYLQAHHIKSWCDYPDLRIKIDNGITLCKNCHSEIHRRRLK